MNILFTISGLEKGGSEIFLSRLVNQLSEHDTIFVLNTHSAVRNKDVISSFSNKISLYHLPDFNILKTGFLNKLDHKFSILYQIQRFFLINLIRKKKIDLIVSFKYHSDSFITAALQNVKTPVVISIRGCYSVLNHQLQHNSEEFEYFRNDVKKIFKRCNAIVWLTRENLDIIQSLGAEIPLATKQIYNGMKKSESGRNNHSDISSCFTIGMVGRGEKIKGWSELINAFLLLKGKTKQNVRLILMGSGQYLELLKREYSKHKDIVFKGMVSYSSDSLKDLDVAVLASHIDAMPNVIIEYLEAEKVIVASNVGEVKEMLSTKNGSAGMVLDLKDGKLNEEELASTLLLLLENPELREVLRNNSRLAFEKFSIVRCALEYHNFFHKINDESSTH